MWWVRRSPHLHFRLEDDQVVAASPLTGGEVVLARDELEVLLDLPSGDWVEAGSVPAARALAERGLAVTDEAVGPLADLRARDELLSTVPWHPAAAAYHFTTRWRDVELRRAGSSELLRAPEVEVDEFIGRHGAPPPAFHEVERPLGVVELPLVEPDGGLFEALYARRTARSFDGAPLALEDLAVVLRTVFGAHGQAPIHRELHGLRKTSPSGGGLHPTEAYPLLANVEDIPPGLYHYRARDHALELLEPLDRASCRSALVEFTAGQTYLGGAQAAVVLTSRFEWSFWKYRVHPKAYAAALVDAGHLSQTLYLVCAARGLGAFVTLAVNEASIDDRLGLDGVTEGTVAVCGFGRPAGVRSLLEPEFLPYVPRTTTF